MLSYFSFLVLEAEPAESPTNVGEPFRGLVFRGATSGDDCRPLVSRSPVPANQVDPRLGTPEEHALVDDVLARAGRNASDYRRNPLIRRLPACLRALQATSLEQARQRLEREPALIAVAIDALLIGATAFYRDPPVFDFVRDEVLPRIVRVQSRPRILSAAVSDGAELFTTAMLMDQMGSLTRASLRGIDCRHSAIAAARRGIYPTSSVKQLAAPLASRYLATEGSSLRIAPQLQRSVHWEACDVGTIGRYGTWDIICCRNLAIYLEPLACKILWQTLSRALRPQGYLVVGKAERPELIGLSCMAPCVYPKR